MGEIVQTFLLPKVEIIWLHLWSGSVAAWHFGWPIDGCMMNQNVKQPHYDARDVTLISMVIQLCFFKYG